MARIDFFIEDQIDPSTGNVVGLTFDMSDPHDDNGLVTPAIACAVGLKLMVDTNVLSGLCLMLAGEYVDKPISEVFKKTASPALPAPDGPEIEDAEIVKE